MITASVLAPATTRPVGRMTSRIGGSAGRSLRGGRAATRWASRRGVGGAACRPTRLNASVTSAARSSRAHRRFQIRRSARQCWTKRVQAPE
jgi:hypothetical protein